MLSINQPLPNSSQVRNVPSVITMGPVQQSISERVHRNFIRIKSFVTGFSFFWTVKIIYQLVIKIKHFKFLFPPLFPPHFVSTCKRKKKTKEKKNTNKKTKYLPSKPFYSLICSCSLLKLASIFGNTNNILG